MRLMGRILQTKHFDSVITIVRNAYTIFLSKHVTQTVLKAISVVNNYNMEDFSTEEMDNFSDSPTEDKEVKQVELEIEVQEAKFKTYWKCVIKDCDTSCQLTNHDDLTKNKYYCPVIMEKLLEWYLPTIPLWSKVVMHKIQSKFDSKNFDDMKARNLGNNINTNAQAEEFFRIKKITTFKQNRRLDLPEFLKQNFEDNEGLLKESASGVINELAKIKSKRRGSMTGALSQSKRMLAERKLDVKEEYQKSDDEDNVVAPSVEIWKKKEDSQTRKRKRSAYMTEPSASVAFDPEEHHKRSKKMKKSTEYEVIREKAWKKEGRRKKSYYEVKAAAKKQADLHQRKKEDEEERAVSVGNFQCNACALFSRRRGMIRSTCCGSWWHSDCIGVSFDLSLKLSAVYCKRCIIETYRNVCVYIYANSSLKTSEMFHVINSETWKCQVIEVNDIAKPIEVKKYALLTSRRGFENRRSNCWVNALLQAFVFFPIETNCYVINR